MVYENNNRNMILISGVISLFIIGMLYAWSVFVAPLEAEFGWTRAQSSGTYTISMICFAVGVLLCGVIADKKPLKAAIAAGALMIGAGFIACSFARSLIMFYIFYGIFCGTGVGICYNAWLSTITVWFPDKAGFASGLLLMGFGMGGMILGSAASLLIYSSLGWRKTFLILGILVLMEAAITMPLLKRPPEGDQEQIRHRPGDRAQSYTTGQMLREPAFWVFTVWKMLLTGLGQSLIGQASLIAVDTGAGIAAATLAVGLLSIGNGAGRVLCGMFFDRFGRFKTIMAISTSFLALGIMFTIVYPMKAWALMCAVLCLTGFCYGGVCLITAAYISDVFGTGYFRSNMGVNSMTNVPATLAGSTLISVIKANTETYQPFFHIMTVICMINVALGLATKTLEKKMRGKGLLPS